MAYSTINLEMIIMKTIIIPNYIPTLIKGVFNDLEVTYTIDEDTIGIDEVFCNGANITDLLTMGSFADLASEIKKILAKETLDAQIALRSR